jgi:hypothetical protein
MRLHRGNEELLDAGMVPQVIKEPIPGLLEVCRQGRIKVVMRTGFSMSVLTEERGVEQYNRQKLNTA